tara:strand:+ start:48 stop:584 length:537 start_codon:yes stop_codon:yes gene_type:complete
MHILRAALGGLSLCLPSAASAYVDGPVADRDGGGDFTCRECHVHDESLAAAGSISVEGFPARFEPGHTYALTLHLTHPDMKRAGFQMSVRGETGTQAGDLAAGESVKIAADPKSGVIFAQHSENGAPFVENHTAAWSVTWTAPEDSATVTVYAAGNASNGDDSALGDVILLLSRTIKK